MGFDEQNKVFGEAPTMLGSDPPTQTRLRRLVSRDFTPRRIRELEPRIREIAKNLIDAAERKGEFDVMADLANPLPVMVISDLLGVPQEDYHQFKNWSDKIVEADNTLPGDADARRDQGRIHRAEERTSSTEIARRRKNPGTDLVSALVAAHDEAEALNADELLQFLVLLLLAGQRDDDQSDWQRNARARTQSRRDGGVAIEARSDARRDRRDAPIRRPRAVHVPHRDEGHDHRRDANHGGDGRVRDHRGGESRPGAIQGS